MAMSQSPPPPSHALLLTAPPAPGIRLLLEQKKRQEPGLCEPIKKAVKSAEGPRGWTHPRAGGPCPVQLGEGAQVPDGTEGFQPQFCHILVVPPQAGHLESADCIFFFFKLLILDLFFWIM
jgi:hypothetical protein